MQREINMKRILMVLVLLSLAALACGRQGGPSAGYATNEPYYQAPEDAPKPVSTPVSTPQKNAWYACTTLIDRQLGLSFMDAQDYSSDRVSSLGSGDYRARIWYANVATEYECVVSHLSSGDWKLVSLTVN
jgi:hypothetical protein